MPGAIHLSMSTISSSAAPTASEHARYAGLRAGPSSEIRCRQGRHFLSIAAGAAGCRALSAGHRTVSDQRTFVVVPIPGHANLIKFARQYDDRQRDRDLAEVVAVFYAGLDPKPFVDI